MSIWGSIDKELVMALDCHDRDAEYNAEGTPSIELDVATTWFHDHVRLALWAINEDGGFEPGMDVCALLSPEMARRLADQLVAAVGRTTETVSGS